MSFYATLPNMMLHEELRRAREAAGLSQAALSARTGVPRNQIVRAERGDNITIDTLRRLAVHLPVTKLTLLDNIELRVNILAEPEKLYVGAAETVEKLAEAMTIALRQMVVARTGMLVARQAEAILHGEEAGEAAEGEAEPELSFKRLGRFLEMVRELMESEPGTELEEPQAPQEETE